jgi:hypothetical protein
VWLFRTNAIPKNTFILHQNGIFMDIMSNHLNSPKISQQKSMHIYILKPVWKNLSRNTYAVRTSTYLIATSSRELAIVSQRVLLLISIPLIYKLFGTRCEMV